LAAMLLLTVLLLLLLAEKPLLLLSLVAVPSTSDMLAARHSHQVNQLVHKHIYKTSQHSNKNKSQLLHPQISRHTSLTSIHCFTIARFQRLKTAVKCKIQRVDASKLQYLSLQSTTCLALDALRITGSRSTFTYGKARRGRQYSKPAL
jgi:hypothetical protein